MRQSLFLSSGSSWPTRPGSPAQGLSCVSNSARRKRNRRRIQLKAPLPQVRPLFQTQLVLPVNFQDIGVQLNTIRWFHQLSLLQVRRPKRRLRQVNCQMKDAARRRRKRKRRRVQVAGRQGSQWKGMPAPLAPPSVSNPLGQGFSTSAILRRGDFNFQDSTAPILQPFLHWSLSERHGLGANLSFTLEQFPENQM